MVRFPQVLKPFVVRASLLVLAAAVSAWLLGTMTDIPVYF
jgi:hypothetical protein